MTISDVTPSDCFYAIASILVICMMQLTDKDPTHERDATWLQWARRGSFIFMASLLVNVIACRFSEFSKDLVIFSGFGAVAINVAVLVLRRKPDSGHKARVFTAGTDSHLNIVLGLMRRDKTGSSG